MDFSELKKNMVRCFDGLVLYVPCKQHYLSGHLFVLRFYGPFNPMGSCRARSVYHTFTGQA